MLDQEAARLSYYRNVPLEDREFILQEHRRSKQFKLADTTYQKVDMIASSMS
jgi:hypothetical protein